MSVVEMNALVKKRKNKTEDWRAEAERLLTPLRDSLNTGREKYSGCDESDRLNFDQNELGVFSWVINPTKCGVSLKRLIDHYRYPTDETRIAFEFTRGRTAQSNRVKITAYSGNVVQDSTSLSPIKPSKLRMKVAEYVADLGL